MNTRRNVIFAAIVLLIIAGLGMWFAFVGDTRPKGLANDGSYAGAPLTKEYRNETFKFSLSMPEGFSAGELPVDEVGGNAVVLQDSVGDGLQIYIVPAGSNERVLTEENVRAAIPDIQIRETEIIEIGREHRGLAFLSDNEAFEGDSREVWFYFRGNLYQISTYARLDTLLKAMFATWVFY